MPGSKMLARYRAVYAVQTTGAPSGSPLDVEIAREDDPRTVARFVSDPLPYCEEIFAWAMIAEGMLKGMFAGESRPRPSEVPESAQQAAALRLKSLPSGRAYLVVDGSYQIEEPSFAAASYDSADPFGAAFHDTLGLEITDCFRDFVHRVLGAIQLAAPLGNPPHLEKVGERAFLFDEVRGKPIYLFRGTAGTPLMYVAQPLTKQAITDVRAFAAVRPQQYDPLRSLELLNYASDNRDDALVNFVNSWSAFELFVAGLFKSRYAATPRQAKHPPPLRKRFEAIAAALDPSNAPGDLAVFDATYSIRNKLFHEALLVDLRQPCHNSQELARKYIRLYYSTPP